MFAPPLEIVLPPYLPDDPQCKFLRLVAGEGAPPEELPRSRPHIVLEEPDQRLVDSVVLEEHSAGHEEVEEGDEGGVVQVVVQGVEDHPLGLLVVLLREGLVGVALVKVEA